MDRTSGRRYGSQRLLQGAQFRRRDQVLDHDEAVAAVIGELLSGISIAPAAPVSGAGAMVMQGRGGAPAWQAVAGGFAPGTIAPLRAPSAGVKPLWTDCGRMARTYP